jgi:hypothetical protein
MALADDFLTLAQNIVNLHTGSPRDPGPPEANLRRAMSTAYYAIFHLLIAETSLNWNRESLRKMLARVFDHGKMKSASDNKISELNAYFKVNPPSSLERTTCEDLRTVCKAFIEAQQRRHDADYNLFKPCPLNDVQDQIQQVKRAFQAWSRIRDTEIAQVYLISLLGAYGEKNQSQGSRK